MTIRVPLNSKYGFLSVSPPTAEDMIHRRLKQVVTRCAEYSGLPLECATLTGVPGDVFEELGGARWATRHFSAEHFQYQYNRASTPLRMEEPGTAVLPGPAQEGPRFRLSLEWNHSWSMDLSTGSGTVMTMNTTLEVEGLAPGVEETAMTLMRDGWETLAALAAAQAL